MSESEARAMEESEFERDLDRHDMRPDEGRWGWSPGRMISVLLLVGVIGFWIWAFSPLAPRGHPDELDDPTFAEAAEIRCAAAVEKVDTEIAPAIQAADGGERADQIEASSQIFEEMLEDLARLAPDPTTVDGDLVARWLADWEIYIGDRYRYAGSFRAGEDDRFVVTVSGEGQITDPIDAFANANNMPSCASPQDV